MTSLFKYLLLFALLLLANITFSQTTKSLYVNNFKYVVGDTVEENKLLEFAVDSGYTYLILYNLYYIHNNLFDITDSIEALPLSKFIRKAKNDYGIEEIAGVGETYNSFNNIHEYNLDHINTPEERIDVYNLEFEFWHGGKTSPGGYYCDTYLVDDGFPCTKDGAFSFILPQLCRIDSLCDEYSWLKSEVYIGNPTRLQCAKLAMCVDRVLVHYYRVSDIENSGNSFYNYKKLRLEALTDSVAEIHVRPIFSGCDNYMGPWLETHPEGQAYNTWWYGPNAFSDETDPWIDKIVIDGYVWYKSTCMLDAVTLAVADIQLKGERTPEGVNLTWVIDQSEELVSYIIQRSEDNASWVEIGEVEHEREKYNYRFLDEDNRELAYYRLLFVGAYGDLGQSNVIKTKSLNNNNWFPNPTNGGISFSSENDLIALKVYDMKGKKIFDLDISKLSFANREFDMTPYNDGVYVFLSTTTKGSFLEKVILIK